MQYPSCCVQWCPVDDEIDMMRTGWDAAEQQATSYTEGRCSNQGSSCSWCAGKRIAKRMPCAAAAAP